MQGFKGLNAEMKQGGEGFLGLGLGFRVQGSGGRALIWDSLAYLGLRCFCRFWLVVSENSGSLF